MRSWAEIRRSMKATWILVRNPRVAKRYLRRNHRGVSEPYGSTSTMFLMMGGYLLYFGYRYEGDERLFLMGLGGAVVISGMNMLMAGRRATDQHRYQKKRDDQMIQLLTEIRDNTKP